METCKRILPNEILLGEVSNLLAEGKEVILMTKGFSMNPFIIGDRDSVLLKKMEPRQGHIALAQIAPGHYVLHRIMSIEGDRVTLHGDGNLRGNEFCTLDKICGCVIAILKPRDRRTDCLSSCFSFRSRLWVALPTIVKRYYLAFFRRIFI